MTDSTAGRIAQARSQLVEDDDACESAYSADETMEAGLREHQVEVCREPRADHDVDFAFSDRAVGDSWGLPREEFPVSTAMSDDLFPDLDEVSAAVLAMVLDAVEAVSESEKPDDA